MTAGTVSISLFYVSPVPSTEPGIQQVIKKYVDPLTNSFDNYFTSVYSVPGTVLDAGDTAADKNGKNPYS